MSLSNIEEKIYFAALDAGPVSIETVKSWKLCSAGTLKVVMHNLVRKGYFWRIKRGLYMAKKPAADDAFRIAQSLYSGYLAFSAALYIHKLADEMPFTLFVATRGMSKEMSFGNYSVKAVALGSRFVGAEKKDGFSVSTVPKTIYDCFHMPRYAGGYANILKAAYNAEMTDSQWKEFIYYVNKFERSAFCQRVGFMLGLAKKETGMRVPDFVLGQMGKKVRSNAVLGKVNIGDLLGWWYHG